jgi:sodium-coupled monocarboxylate transporter 8/12
LQYLELRFGQVTRLAASVAFSLQMILYMGIVLYAPALALEAVTGLSKTLSGLIIGLVCTFYSTIGGMKAVIITDVFQVGEKTFEKFIFLCFHFKGRSCHILMLHFDDRGRNCSYFMLVLLISQKICSACLPS